MECVILPPEIKGYSLEAQMAELVDATDSKSVVRKDVQVRFLFWAQEKSVIIDLQAFLFLSIASAFTGFYRILPLFLIEK